jgi:hypothetical protein
VRSSTCSVDATTSPLPSPSTPSTRDALKFFFSDQGRFARDFLLDETVKSVDAVSRGTVWQLTELLNLPLDRLPLLGRLVVAAAPRLADEDHLVLQNAERLITFFSMGSSGSLGSGSGSSSGADVVLALTGPERAREGRLSLVTASSPSLVSGGSSSSSSSSRSSGGGVHGALLEAQATRMGVTRERAAELQDLVSDFGPAMREFGSRVVARLADRTASRLLKFAGDAVFGTSRASAAVNGRWEGKRARLIK